MQVILSTRNPSKIDQIRALFKETDVSILSLDEANIDGEAIEDGTTLDENAAKKARYAYQQSHGTSWTMADDTGLFLDALNGEPGVRSARWAGEGATTAETTKYCLDRLYGKEDRTGAFKTVVVVMSPAGWMRTFYGEIRGTMLEAPRVPPQPKMPYSALFVPDGKKSSWAEMTVEQENAISHRGIAFRKALKFFEEVITQEKALG